MREKSTGCSRSRGGSPASIPEQPEEATSSFGSPLAHAGYVYYVSKAGILNCVDLKTGELKWDRRLGDSCWASPVAAEGRLYFFGKVYIINSNCIKGRIKHIP